MYTNDISRRASCVASFAALVLCGETMSAQVAPDTRKMADFLMAGIQDGRERLRQGVVRGRGHHASLYADRKTLDFEIEFFFAFDWDKNLFRCERQEPRLVVSGRPPTRRNAGRLETSRDVYFRDAGRSVQHNTRWAEIQIHREDFRIRRSLHAFDLRAVGLLYRDSYEDQLPFGKILELFKMDDLQEVVDEGEGIYRVRWVLDGAVRRTIWLNRREGFSVTRFEVADNRSTRMPIGEDGWPLPFLINEATWMRVKDVWVPKTFRIHDRTGADDAKPFWRYDHAFDWQSVNEPLSGDLFDIDKLGAKKGTLVADYRGKSPVVERVIGVENTRLEGESARKRDRPPPLPPPIRGLRFWLLVGNAVLLALAALVYLWRRAMRRTLS